MSGAIVRTAVPPVCYTKVDVEKLVYTWQMPNYKQHFGDLNGEVDVDSAIFYSWNKQSSWQLSLYQSSSDTLDDNIGIFINLISSGDEPLLTTFKLTIVNTDPELSVSYEQKIPQFLHQDSKVGKIDIINKTSLLNDGFLKDNNLTVVCELAICNGSLNVWSEYNPKLPKCHISEDFLSLLESSKLSDITILIGRHKFHLHRAILVARSNFFAKLFESYVGNENLQLSDTDFAVFQEMIHFMYTDRICTTSMTVKDLMAASVRFMIPGLKAACEEWLINQLSEKTAVDTLLLADLYGADGLKSKVLHFIKQKELEIMQLDGWRKAPNLKSHLHCDVLNFLEDTKVINNATDIQEMSSAAGTLHSDTEIEEFESDRAELDQLDKRNCSHFREKLACVEESVNTLSVTEHSTQTICFTWNLINFSFLCKNDQEMLESPKFYHEDHPSVVWFLSLCPNGDSEPGEYYLSIYLKLAEKGSDNVLARVQFSIKGLTEECEDLIKVSSLRKFDSGSGYGFSKFISQNEILEDEGKFLINDTLTIHCTVTTLNETCQLSSAFDSNEKINCLSSDLGVLLKNRILCDVTLNAGGEDFQCHKAILSARSPIFAAMFNQYMTGSEGQHISISDIDKDVMRELLSFIYCGKAGKAGSMTVRLLAAAEKYMLPQLREICEQELCTKITTQSAAVLLKLADQYQCQELKSCVTSFIKMHLRDVSSTRSWRQLSMKSPHLIEAFFKNDSSASES